MRRRRFHQPFKSHTLSCRFQIRRVLFPAMEWIFFDRQKPQHLHKGPITMASMSLDGKLHHVLPGNRYSALCNQGRWVIKFECPYCGETFEYQNWLVWVFKNPFHSFRRRYTKCTNCKMRSWLKPII